MVTGLITVSAVRHHQQPFTLWHLDLVADLRDRNRRPDQRSPVGGAVWNQPWKQEQEAVRQQGRHQRDRGNEYDISPVAPALGIGHGDWFVHGDSAGGLRLKLNAVHIPTTATAIRNHCTA